MRTLFRNARKSPRSLAVLFLVGVLLPSAALSALALRAASREALYVERRLESSLLAEVSAAVRRVTDAIAALGEDLGAQARDLSPDLHALETWQRRQPLVAVPFLLREGVLSIPDPGSPAGTRFLEIFGPFLRDGAPLPIYDRIAHVYRRHIQEPEGGEMPLAWESEKIPDPVENGASLEKTARASRPKLSALLPGRYADAPMPVPPPQAPAPDVQDAAGRQVAESLVAADTAVRQEAYRQAAEGGFQLLQRNVLPRDLREPSKDHAEALSAFVSRQSTLTDLRRQGTGGLVPRLSDKGLDLLLWVVRNDGAVAGAQLRPEPLRDHIVAALPELYTEARILTVLNDQGSPLVGFPLPISPDWRRPFVAREISPTLPHWEVAAYLPDPGVVTSRAQMVTVALWILVATLLVAIAAGGTLVLRALAAETRLAGQKTTFVANVSHELKTPLTSIRLFAELLLQKRQPDEERREEYLRIMVAESERLSRLVDNVLTFSRQEAGRARFRFEILDLGALASDVVAQLRPHLEHQGFSITVTVSEPLAVEGDGEALRQVLMNLLSNAEKYADGTRSIDLEAHRQGQDAVVAVLDRGIGVERPHVDRIFEEFFRVDDALTASRRGTGLGLPIARRIARDHGGDVTYAPRPGGGSVFSLGLPLCPPPPTEGGDVP